ncbi:MAG TPA: ABC transporter permease [Bryobacteraceae bacterium]|nr:ABC transporter permease [Bryobacteraceae bacterium]
MLRHAIRSLARTPAFAAVAIATLALGIGANSAVFSAIDAVLLKPLPFPDGDRLMRLQQVHPRNPNTFVAPVRLTDWSRLNSTFRSISGFYTQDGSETSGELPEKLRQAFVAPRFLEVWGISPKLGRDFRPDEERFGGPNAVLISERLWRRRFNADPNILGRQLRLSTFTYSIVGVLPASFAFSDPDVDLWSPNPMDAPYAQDRAETWFNVIGRLKPGITLEQARANLITVQANLGAQFPKTDADLTVNIQPLKEVRIGGVQSSLWILFGSVSLLLLIACANIAALLLARATARRQEISVRFSLGATRAAVVRVVLAEAFVLAFGGGLLGLALAAGAIRALRILAANLPRVSEIGLDWRVALYTLGCSMATTLLCGLLPAMLATAGDVLATLAHSSRTQVAGRRPLQYALVGIQVALAVTLLAGAGLLLRSFQELGRVSPGFESSHVLTLQISSSWGETADMQALGKRTERILDWLASTPGVEGAAMSMSLPGVPEKYQVEMQLAEGRAETEPKLIAESRAVSPSYFETMRIPLLAGETCRVGTGVPNVVVNRAFADAYLNGSALGFHLRLRPGGPPTEIRGVVGNAREAGMNREPVPTVYGCYEIAQPGANFLVRTRTAPSAMDETIRRRIHEIEPLRSVYGIMPLEEHFTDAFAENRFRTILLTFFALTAVSLASVGLYGMLGYLVAARRREVGLRLALGAMRGQILSRFLLEGLGITMAGCAAGIGLALAFAKLLSGMLYGVTAWDKSTLASVVVLVLVVAALASLIPSVRAARVEPMQVLRDE